MSEDEETLDTKQSSDETKEKEVKKTRKKRSKVLRVNPLESMETILEKLKILDYERDFCSAKSRKPFTRTYFAIKPEAPENTSTQLASFLKIISWLMELNGRDFMLDKFDDPTTSVNKLMVDLKQMGFTLNFPATKLRQGHGEAVCTVLNYLCDGALSKRQFSFENVLPEYPEELEDNADVDEDADMGAVEDDIAESSEEEIMYTQMVQQESKTSGKKSKKSKDQSEARKVLETNTDAIRWKAELERVSTKLSKLGQYTSAIAEWRTYIYICV